MQRVSRRQSRLNRLQELREQAKAVTPAIIARHEASPIVIVQMTEVR